MSTGDFREKNLSIDLKGTDHLLTELGVNPVYADENRIKSLIEKALISNNNRSKRDN